MSATSSPGNSPAKPASKSQLPASIASASLEDLQKLFVDSLKRLKVKDKRIAELSASQEALQVQVSQHASISSSQEGLQQQLHAASEEAKAAQRRADDAQEQFEGMYKSYAAQQQQLEDAAAEKTIHAEQMASLKEVLRTMAQEKDSAEKEVKQSQSQLAQLKTASETSDIQAQEARKQLANLQSSTEDMQSQLSQALSQLEVSTTQHEQELQSVHAERESTQQEHAGSISELEHKLSAAEDACQQANTTISQLQEDARPQADADQQVVMDTMQQQHAESLGALQSELAGLQDKLSLAEEAKAKLQVQLNTARTAQEQQCDQASSFQEQIAYLKQELHSRESTPDSTSGELQQQLDSAKADAAKQASKLEQAEMRASLVRQQLQEAQHQVRQFEDNAMQQPRADQLQESLDKAHTELTMLQGRLSPTEGQMSSSSSENGIATPSSPGHVKVIINVASGESGPEPPSVFYAEQKRTKQKLTSLKAERQQLQKELSALQQTIEQQTAELGDGPQQLADAHDTLQSLQEQHSRLERTLTAARASEAELRDQLTSSDASYDMLKGQLTELQGAMDTAAAEAADMQQQLQAATAGATSVREQLNAEQSNTQDAEAHASKLESEVEHAQAEAEHLQRQLTDLRQAQEAERSSAEAAQAKVKHQLKAAEIDRETLQQQISALQEAVIKAQHRPVSPPSPGPLKPSAEDSRDDALKELKDDKADLLRQLSEAQHTSSHAAAAAQAEVNQLRSELKTVQAAMQTVESERASLEEQLAAAQEDAGKAQDAATAVASLESELQQAKRREEQLRASRAQCEYQLQAGEEAQALLKPTITALHLRLAGAYKAFGGPGSDPIPKAQTSAPNSGMVSPAKSEFSDDGESSQNLRNEAMQKQLDWLLTKLMTAESTFTAADQADTLQNGSSPTMLTAPHATPRSAAAAHTDDHQHNSLHLDADLAQVPADASSQQSDASGAPQHTHDLQSQLHDLEVALTAAQQETGSLNKHVTQLQSDLELSQQKAEHAESLRQQVTELTSRLNDLQQQPQQHELLRQQLADPQPEMAGISASSTQTQESDSADVEALQHHISQLQTELASMRHELEAAKPHATESSSQLHLSEAPPSSSSDQQQAQQSELLQAQLAELRNGLSTTEAATGDREPLKQQLEQLQADLHASHTKCALLQQQLEDVKAQAPFKAEKPVLSSSTSLQPGDESMNQPSASMTTAEADLVEAASSAIQAQVSPSDGKMDEDVSRDELAEERSRLATELADAKRKFMAVAKRKQQEYSKKIKELEDSLLLAQQASAQLQIQLDTAIASGQSQALELAAAQSGCTELSAGLEAVQSQLAEAQANQAAAREALTAQQALMGSQEQQRALQEEEAKKVMATAQEEVAAAHKEAEAERDRFKKVVQELKKKLDRSSKESIKAEVAAAEARGKAEAEKAGLQTALETALSRAEAEQSGLQATVQGLETDAKEYKLRAHNLLRQKEAEVSRSRESAALQFQADVAAAQAAAQHTQQLLEQAQADLVSSNDEWDSKVQALLKQHQDALSGLRTRLEQQDGDVRSASLSAEQFKAKCVSLEQRLEEVHAQQPAVAPGLTPQQQEEHAAEVQHLQQHIHRLHQESEVYRTTASSVAEAKDAELERVLATNARLRQDLASLQHARMAAGSDKTGAGGQVDVAQSTVSSPELPTSFSAAPREAEDEEEAGWQGRSRAGSLMRQGSHSSYVSTSRPDMASQSGLLEQLMSYDNGLQESALLRLPERQAGREEELAEARQRAEEADVRAEDLGQDVSLLQQQVAALKEVCQELERQAGRAKLVAAEGSVDLEYLKNIMLKLYETGEAAALLPVLGTVLKFSPAELARCQSAVSAAAEQQSSLQTAVARTAAASDASAADSAGYLTGWSIWPFGEETPKK